MSLAATGLAACGGGAEGNGNTGADCNPADVTVSGDGTATAPEECNFEGQTLTVAAYTGAMTEALQAGVGKLVEEATGATIEWVGVDNATAISQILASRGAAPPFDVVSAMTTVDQISLVDSQLLVEPSNLDEFADFPEQAFGAEGYQPGFYYFVTGMCVRSDKMAEAGLDATEGFDLLQEPALAGKVAFPNAGISQWDLLVPAISDYLGSSVDDPSATIDWLNDIDGLKFWASSGDLDQWLTAGDVWAAPATDGRCLALQEQGVPVEYHELDMEVDGTTYSAVGATTGAYVVAGTEVSKLAEIYVHLVNQPAGLMPYLTDRAIYRPTNPETFTALEAEAPERAALLTGDPATYYQADYEAFLESRPEWIEQWNREFQG